MFGTSGIRGKIGEDVTASLGVSLGRALAIDTNRVVVGRDCRESGEYLADAVAAGLRESGTDVIRIGLASTPTVARSVSWQNADAGVSITASHNPPSDNGFKLWQVSGQAFDESLRTTISNRIQEETFTPHPWNEIGRSQVWEQAHVSHVNAITNTVGSSNLSVVVDLGNGVGRVTVDTLLDLGCTVETLNAQPDGGFPSRPSEPTAENCEVLCRYVAESDADIGIAHDGDADRMLAVTEHGDWIPGDILLTVFAQAAANNGDQIAVPIDTSLVVKDTLEKIGSRVTYTPVGDVYVAERTQDPGVVFGGEPSGAWIWPDETLCPDGPLAAAKLIELVSNDGPISEIINEFDPYPIHRDQFRTNDKTTVIDRIQTRVHKQYEDIITLDGVRVDLTDGWFLIRASGTEPIIRVTAEARTEERATAVFAEASAIVTEVI